MPYLEQAEIKYMLAILRGRLDDVRAVPSRHANEPSATEAERALVSTLMLKLLATVSTDRSPVTQEHVTAEELRLYDVALWAESGQPYAVVAATVPCAEHGGCHLVSYVLNQTNGHRRSWLEHTTSQAVARPR